LPDYNALKVLVNSDPTFTGKSDQQVADALNALTETEALPAVPLPQVAIWAARTGVRGRIEAAASNPNSPVQGICLMLRDFFSGLTGPALELDNPDNLAMLDALVASGVMTADNRTTLLALQNHPTSRALKLAGWGIPVQAPDIAWVRSH
jgi:hypothetical protein